MSWETVTLGDIAITIQTGPFGSQLHQSDYSEAGIPVVMPKDLLDGKIIENSIARVEEIHVERLSRYKIKKGDIIYSRRGDVGRCAFAGEKEAGWLCGTGCLCVTIDVNKANAKFVFYQLQLAEIIGWVKNHAVGSTMLNLNTNILENIPVNIPDLCIQNRIVDILSAYDDLIENNKKQIKLLEEMAQRLYKEWFVDLHFPGYENVKIVDGVPEEWRKEKLINLCDVQYGYAFDGSLFNDKSEGTPIIRIRDIPVGYSTDYTTEQADERYVVENGEIVVGMDGEFHINSWSGEDSYLVQRVCCFRPHDEIIKGWLLWALYEPIKYFEKTVVGATVSHLGKKHIDTIELLKAPRKLYVPFNIFFEKRQLLLNQNQKLFEARDRLLPKFMNGEIEV